MKRTLGTCVFALLAFGSMAFAHDPRTAIKDYGTSLSIEETGTISLSFKAMHWNEQVFQQVKNDPATKKRLNDGLWSKIGSASFGFDIVVGETALAKGSYSLGINFTDLNQLQLVLTSSAGKKYSIPLQTSDSASSADYLSFAFFPTDAVDTFQIEGRYGKLRATQSFKVPALGPHTHSN